MMKVCRTLVILAVLFGFVLIFYATFLHFASGPSDDFVMFVSGGFVRSDSITRTISPNITALDCHQKVPPPKKKPRPKPPPTVEARDDRIHRTLPTELPTQDIDIWFSTYLLILIPIRPSGKEPRQLIRDTWFEGYNTSKDVALRFIVGTKKLEAKLQDELIHENRTFGDITFVDSVEGVDTLTNKTLGLVNWAHHHVNFSYMLKCDDDTYVFVENTINELRKRPTTTKLYYGVMKVDNPPIRGKAKWADNKWDLGKTYLPFALGGGYILSHDLVGIVSELSSHLMWHINEDTSIGSWVSAFDHERRSDGKFCFWIRGSRFPNNCRNPPMVLLMFGHSESDRKKHFYYFHEHANSDSRILDLMKASTLHLKIKT